MRLIIGTIQFAANAVAVTTERSLLRDSGGRGYATLVRLSAQGQIYGDSQTELSVASALLDASLVGVYPDIVFEQDNGLVAFAIRNAGSTTGVQVVSGPNFPVGIGAEYTTWRTFSLIAEAEYPLVSGLMVLEFVESVAFSGGAPFKVMVAATATPAQRQTIHLFAPFMVTQQGHAVGYGAYPPVPPALFPNDLLEAPRVNYTSPQRRGFALSHYAIDWAYSFGSATALGGLPTLPPP